MTSLVSRAKKVAFQGEPGAYANLAAREALPHAQAIPKPTFEDAINAVRDGETDLAEGADDVVGDLRERMQFAERAAAAGQGEIGRLFRQRGFQFEFFAAANEGGFEFDFGGVHGFAGEGLFLFGKCAEPFHQGGEFAVGAEPGAFGLLQRGEVGRGFQFGHGGLFQRFNFVE